MTASEHRFLDLMNFTSPEEAYAEVKKLASGLSDRDHLTRSCIFDLHAAVEVELQRIIYHTFKKQTFLTDDEVKNEVVLRDLDRMVGRLGFMDMYRILNPILKHWPYPDFESIGSINETRNQAAHGGNVEKVRYKGRNPFQDADCFAQMYFDVWAIKQEIGKFFWHVIEKRDVQFKRYIEKYGTELL